MAKGRKLTNSHSERYIGSYSTYSHENGTVNDMSELGEDDVWSSVDGGDDHFSNYSRGEWLSRATPDNNFRSRRAVPGAEHHRQVGGLSLAFDDSGKKASPRILHQFRGHDSVAGSRATRHVATSAPVNVPDWSKIYRVDSVESINDSDGCVDDNDWEMVPPHEYARSRNSAAHSVYEGVGRTLKGRDLSRVRDAVWSQTGFDG